MKIVFISYWGINQGLTQSTVLPHVETLLKDKRVISLSLITFERESYIPLQQEEFKHIPIEEFKGIKGLNKFTSIRKCYQILKTEKPDLVIARSSLAGIPAYHYFKKTNTPYIVESFEPHADYMIDAKEWKKSGIKPKLIKRYSKKIALTARFLLPVSHKYKDKLVQDGISSDRIIVLPCTVDHHLFAHSIEQRNQIRAQFGIAENVFVGIYVGKFGGLYQSDQAFKTFKRIGKQFESFEMIILSPSDPNSIRKIAGRNGFPLDKLHISSVQQHEVPAYLSAADIGLATFKSFNSNQYCSPIKIGEYWAAGLFTCITENVGDDSDIIERNNIGSIIEKKDDVATLIKSFKKEDAVIAATKYRNRNLITEAYQVVLNSLNSSF